MHKGRSYFGVAALVLVIVIVAVFAGRETLFKGALRGAACGAGDIICLKEQIKKTQRQYDNARAQTEKLEKLVKRYGLISAQKKLEAVKKTLAALRERLARLQAQLEKEKFSPSRATCKRYAQWNREGNLTRSHRDVYEAETHNQCVKLYASDFFSTERPAAETCTRNAKWLLEGRLSRGQAPRGFSNNTFEACKKFYPSYFSTPSQPIAPVAREGVLGNPCISSSPGRGYCANFAKCDQAQNLCVAPQKFDKKVCDQFNKWAIEGKLTRNVPDLNRQAEVVHSCAFYSMQEREAAAPPPTFGPAPTPQPGFGPPPTPAPTPQPGFAPLPAGSASFSLSVNGYPDAPSQALANVHVNVYTVTPVRGGIYEGKLRETLKTGNDGESAKTVIKTGEIVDFVAFQDFEKAKNVWYWTFTAPPWKNFNGRICQTNYLDTNSVLRIKADGSESCTTGLGNPAQDRSGSSVVLVPKANAEKPYANFEVWVQETNDPASTVRAGAKVRLYEGPTKKQIGEGITDHRGAVTFIIETGRKFTYDAQIGPDKHYGVDNIFYITDDGKHIRSSVSQDETAVMRVGAYRKEPEPSHPAPIPVPDIEQDMDVLPAPAPAIQLPKISLDLFPLLPTPPAPESKEDCVAFKPLNLLVTNLGRGSFSLDDDGHLIANFPDEAEAKRARRIIQQFKLGEICFSGRGTEKKPMTYWLTESHKAPTGSLPKTDGAEDCLPFNPSNLTVKQEATDRYFIMDGGSSMMMTSSRSAALERIQILQKYGMNKTCYVGRPDPSMMYFKAL